MGSNSALRQIQKISSQTQIMLQKLVNSSNELQAKYNAQEAQKSRDWQTQMSKTAHQMEVEDLKKAGLNPVLSSGGSGAQSYTTSSASISPESGASAAAGVQESQIGALGNMEASRISAAATKQAAAVSARAMREAASTAAAAAMYGATMDYKAKRYASDNSVKSTRIKANADKWISQNKQASSWSGVFDKYFSKLTSSSVRSGFRVFNKRFITGANNFVSNPGKYFSNSGKITASNFRLNSVGVSFVNRLLQQNGLKPTANNRNLFMKAYVFKNPTSYNSMLGSYVSHHYAHGAHSTPRRGHL